MYSVLHVFCGSSSQLSSPEACSSSGVQNKAWGRGCRPRTSFPICSPLGVGMWPVLTDGRWMERVWATCRRRGCRWPQGLPSHLPAHTGTEDVLRARRCRWWVLVSLGPSECAQGPSAHPSPREAPALDYHASEKWTFTLRRYWIWGFVWLSLRYLCVLSRSDLSRSLWPHGL